MRAAGVATCHCGAIRIRVRRLPRSLTSCNCSICRRYGALWAYYTAPSVTIEAPARGLAAYAWNRRTRLYHRCIVCGVVTHYTYRRKRSRAVVAVNASNFDLAVIAAARVRLFDGAGTGRYVGQSAAGIQKSRGKTRRKTIDLSTRARR